MHTKTKLAINICFVIVLLFVITVFFAPFVNLFSSIPMRLLAILTAPILFVVIVLVFNRIEKQSLTSLGFQKAYGIQQILIGVALFALLSVLFILCPILLGVPWDNLLPGKDNLLFALVHRIIFIGFSEELVFRGYLLDRLIRVTGSRFASVVISSLLFGAWHVISTGSFITVILTSVIGAILGLAKAYIKNCTILSVALAHGLYDGLLVLLSAILL